MSLGVIALVLGVTKEVAALLLEILKAAQGENPDAAILLAQRRARELADRIQGERRAREVLRKKGLK